MGAVSETMFTTTWKVHLESRVIQHLALCLLFTRITVISGKISSVHRLETDGYLIHCLLGIELEASGLLTLCQIILLKSQKELLLYSLI